MTTPTFAPPVSPSVNSQKTVQPRVLKAEFGDGYRQRAADGLNSRPAAWDLKWDALTTADADTIEAFLDDRGGVEAFWWTPLDAATPRKFIAESWSRAPIVGAEALGERRFSLSAKLTQVFDL
ncbi:phage tail protein [Azospirillum canadense]|uniref:phage tail protein n=1 Tax=Azospirillum canadense TaxID=403962 RepID=UPI0022279D95|nr:phage tail protein [Azospirillum canadense]MCW2242809.1 phage-related protein [Azospirillum canadense]